MNRLQFLNLHKRRQIHRQTKDIRVFFVVLCVNYVTIQNLLGIFLGKEVERNVLAVVAGF